MIYNYKPSVIKGVYDMYPKVFRDDRGTITKIFHKESFEELGLECDWGESLITENYKKHIIRGFHFQEPPYCQAKTIYCVTGAVKNWVLDLRKGSPTYGKIDVFEISNEKRNFLYVPKGIANGYMIQADETIIAYNLTSKYVETAASGIFWGSLGLDIEEDVILSDKDANLIPWGEFESPFTLGENC